MGDCYVCGNGTVYCIVSPLAVHFALLVYGVKVSLHTHSLVGVLDLSSVVIRLS